MKLWQIYLRGLLMGAADLVPGISGGTVAFITGIYERLIASLSSFTPKLFLIWQRQGWRAVWQTTDAFFLLALGAGVFTSLISLAHLMRWLLTSFPMHLNGLFFGLVAGSAVIILQSMQRLRWQDVLVLAISSLIATKIALFLPSLGSLSLLTFYLAGMLAICAMLLPGVSGSFILLTLGLYAPVITAITEFNWAILSVFSLGALSGLICFSHILHWLFKHRRQATFASLLGFVLGSLPQLWPWQQLTSYRVDAQGQLLPLAKQMLLPQQFSSTYSEPAFAVPVILLMLIGLGLVVFLARKK